jgi:periplasmic divalent cation tolerance protein
MNDVIVVLTNAPDEALATKMGAALVEQKLAACVNILGACRSVYRWQGKVETAREVPLLIKTTRARYAEVEAVIRAMHVYEVPEIIVLPVENGLPAYLDWVRAETAAPLNV